MQETLERYNIRKSGRKVREDTISVKTFLNEKLRRNDTKISEFQFEVLENGLEISLCEDKNGKMKNMEYDDYV